MSKLLEPVIKLSKKKWLRQILLHCFAKDDRGIKIFAHDYSAVVYAQTDGKLLFDSFRAFKEPFDLKMVRYIGNNPLPAVQAVNNEKPQIILLSKEPVQLFAKKKERFEALNKERKLLEYIILKQQSRKSEWEPKKRSLQMLEPAEEPQDFNFDASPEEPSTAANFNEKQLLAEPSKGIIVFSGIAVDEPKRPRQYLNKEHREIYDHITRERKLELAIDSLDERWPEGIWLEFLEECKKHQGEGGQHIDEDKVNDANY